VHLTVARSLTVALSLVLLWRPAAADDLEGKALFKKHCGTCHTAEKGGGKRQGPNLFGVVGRKAGTLPGFAYSDALRENKDGIVWARETLDRWLTDPQAFIPGVVMPYKQADPAIRQRLIGYLDTLH
jgi:cytochrome c